MRTRNFLIILLTILSVAPMLGANDKERIKEIKRSKEYFYAEATLNSVDEAKEAANVFLANFINDYLKENNIESETVKSTNLKDVEYITEDKGEYKKVFAYIPRSTYVPTASVPNKSTNSSTANANTEKTKEESFGNANNNYNDNYRTGNNTTSILTAPVQKIETKTIENLLPGERDAIEEIVSAGTLQSILRKLNELKAENIIKRYGPKKDCKNEYDCFWLITQGDSPYSIVAILGPGSDQRQNLMSGDMQSLNDWKGQYKTVWFQF